MEAEIEKIRASIKRIDELMLKCKTDKSIDKKDLQIERFYAVRRLNKLRREK